MTLTFNHQSLARYGPKKVQLAVIHCLDKPMTSQREFLPGHYVHPSFCGESVIGATLSQTQEDDSPDAPLGWKNLTVQAKLQAIAKPLISSVVCPGVTHQV